ncbi:hypothetical protein AAFC00_000458 [Neodothiora populina]|uniref:PWWP domain-containing protein n=1 Tax=Neodothiora populina TaxID=2781224 RepID=A0ABR3PCY1_9PEZI
MAEEQATTAPEETQTTTAPEATNENSTDAPATTSDNVEATPSTDAAADEKPAEKPEADPATAGEQATTEATGPDGQTAQAETAPSEGASAATPASAKGKRKSTGGVPEHKNKKANKRKSMVNIISGAQPGDYFFAKFKGYAPWPSIICDESMLPETLLATRPVSTINAQGELRADYREDGKNAKDRTYPIMFLETNEFAWIVNTALTPLNPGDTAEDKLKPKMSQSLKNAYALAEERHDIEYFKQILQEHQEAEKELQEELAAKEAEKAEKAAKKQERTENEKVKEKKEKRKSTAKSKDAVSDEDEMDVDGKAEAAKPSKKRKKEAESEGEGAKPKKTPKTIKLKAEKTPNGDSAKKTEKKKKIVSKPEETEEKEVLTDAQKLAKRETAVLYLRHRMQRGFLTRDQIPKEEEMDTMAELFSQLEAFDNIEPTILRKTKINKVLKGIVKLAFIPKEEEYHFKKRSNDLLAQWNTALDQSKAETPTDAPATDGEAKTNGEAAEKDEAAEAAPAEEPVETEQNGHDARDEAADTVMTDAPKEDKPEEATAESAIEKPEEKAEEKTEEKTEDQAEAAPAASAEEASS